MLKLAPLGLFRTGGKALHFLGDLTGFYDQVFLTGQTTVETRNRGIRPLRFSACTTREAEVDDHHHADHGQKNDETSLQPSVQRESSPAYFLGGGGEGLKRSA